MTTGNDYPTPFNLFGLLDGYGPKRLDQPILPGWSFGNVIINGQNSAAPETEREIVSAVSYGRQIGRLIDAVCALVKEQPPGVASQKPFVDLLAMQDKVEQIKVEAAKRRAESFIRDLATVKSNNKGDYDALVAELKKATGA
jgi:hypothetical protein